MRIEYGFFKVDFKELVEVAFGNYAAEHKRQCKAFAELLVRGELYDPEANKEDLRASVAMPEITFGLEGWFELTELEPIAIDGRIVLLTGIMLRPDLFPLWFKGKVGDKEELVSRNDIPIGMEATVIYGKRRLRFINCGELKSPFSE